MVRSSGGPFRLVDGAVTARHVGTRHGSRWSIVIAVLSVAIMAAVGDATLHRYSDVNRRSETLLARLEGLAHRLIALEWHAEAKNKVAPLVIKDVEDVRRQMSVALNELKQLDSNGPTSRRVSTAFHRYETNVRKLYQLFAAEQYAEAEAWDKERVHPSYDALLLTIAEASRRYQTSAQYTYVTANIGSSLTMALAALLTSLVFWRFEKIRYTANLLAVEQEALRHSEKRFRSLVKNASDVIVIAEPDGLIRYLSPAAERAWGDGLDILRSKHLAELVHPDDLARFQHLWVQTLCQPHTNITTELRLKHGSDTCRCFEVIANNLVSDPEVRGIVVTYHDITERKKFEEQLTQLAFYDPISKLPNRALFMVRLEHALARLERTNNSVAVLVLDLDNFKVINDSLGHQVGDHLLIAVAERLKAGVRPTDTIARLGGDEFTILLEDVDDISQAIHTVERIQEQLEAPFMIHTHEIFTGASIGIALSESHHVQPDHLLRDADLAMYRAKSNGKAHYAVFDRSLTDRAQERLKLETDLRRAIERQSFKLHYQPIINLETNSVNEVEALVRWEHPERGLISPGEFIPIAEETGLILPLGQWVLTEACRQAVVWQRAYACQPPLIMGVNLSPRQFQDPNLVANIAQTLHETGLDPRCLKIEITERMMMQDSEASDTTLRELKQLGVLLAIDDFGTGYCSLNYLKRFPVDTLKIDRSFINGLGHNPEDTAIVRAVIAFAKALSLSVTGEGIETAEQLAQLRTLECHRGQGYYFSRPLSSEACGALFADNRARMPLADCDSLAACV